MAWILTLREWSVTHRSRVFPTYHLCLQPLQPSQKFLLGFGRHFGAAWDEDQVAKDGGGKQPKSVLLRHNLFQLETLALLHNSK